MLLTAYAVSHIYIFICLRRAFGGGLWQIPALAWLACMACAWFFRWGRTVGAAGRVFDLVLHAWMGLLIFLAVCFFLADLIALLSRLLAFAFDCDPFKKAAAWLTAPRYVPIAIGLAVLLFINGVVLAHTPQVREVVIETKLLPPASKPLRIVGVTDVHITGFIGAAFLNDLADKVNELKPDIFLMCGDLVDSNLNGRDEEATALRKVNARFGKFAVTGNHEAYRGLQMSLDFMKRSGLRVLRGEAVNAGGVSIVGVDDKALAGRSPETTDALAALKKADRAQYVILLNHQPVWNMESVGLFDLQYSGHTHGGQIWPGVYITKRRYKIDQGMNLVTSGAKQSLLYVSNGTGHWGPPIRFLAPAEITLIILKPEQ